MTAFTYAYLRPDMDLLAKAKAGLGDLFSLDPNSLLLAQDILYRMLEQGEKGRISLDPKAASQAKQAPPSHCLFSYPKPAIPSPKATQIAIPANVGGQPSIPLTHRQGPLTMAAGGCDMAWGPLHPPRGSPHGPCRTPWG